MSRRGVVPGIQYARGIAALFVVADHCAAMMAFPEYHGASPSAALLYGYIGVPLFFVISGFVINIVSLDSQGRAAVTIKDYFTKRFARIVPFMWLCIIAYAAVRYLGTKQTDLAPTIRALFLWPIGEIRPNVIWTLRHEALFYTIFAITLLRERQMKLALYIWFGSPILLAVANLLIPDWRNGVSKTAVELIELFLNPANLCFGGGYFLGMIYQKEPEFFKRRISGGFGLTLFASMAMFAIVAAFGLRNGILPYIAILAMSMAIIFMALFVDNTHSWIDGLGNTLGNASYSIYLIHNLVLLIALELASRFLQGANLWAMWVVYVSLAVCSGVAVHLVVEKPLVGWLSRRLARPLTASDRAMASERQ